MPEFTFKVPPEQSGMRVDVFVTSWCAAHDLPLSRTAVQDMLKQGKITLNGAPRAKAHGKVSEGDEVKIIIEEKKPYVISPEEMPLDIIFEDDDIIVVNKPCGLVVHPAPGNYEHTLVHALLAHCTSLSDINPQRPGIVHRLDKDTSGLLAAAKNNVAHRALAGQFAGHTISRVYVAVVKGKMEFDENVIDIPIGRHPVKRKEMTAHFSGDAKYARTHYRTLRRTEDWSVVELRPFTGRTHQLRVHLAFIGHPVLGDKIYGSHDTFPRLALHAKLLGFVHPRSGEYVEFSCGLPEEFEKFFKGYAGCREKNP